MTTDHNPFAPPAAAVGDVIAFGGIDGLAVSETWKARFRAFHKAGGPKRPNIKSLSREERMKISSPNILAFFFGPFYYLFKGMWRKGISLLLVCTVVIVILQVALEAAGLASATKALNFISGVVYGTFANGDYYRKMVLGENGWW